MGTPVLKARGGTKILCASKRQEPPWNRHLGHLTDTDPVSMLLHLHRHLLQSKRYFVLLLNSWLRCEQRVCGVITMTRFLRFQSRVTAYIAGGNITRNDHRIKHERDNRALQVLLGVDPDPFPMADVWGPNHAIWQTSLTDAVRNDFGVSFARLTDASRQHYAQEGGLEKHELFIADWLTAAHAEGLASQNLQRLCQTIIAFANTR